MSLTLKLPLRALQASVPLHLLHLENARLAGWPAEVRGPLDYKGCSLWPNPFSPLILPMAMR